MPVYRLDDDSYGFPPAEGADEDGVVAVGGDLCVEHLVQAYAQGIFPWYSEGLPIIWHSPDPRFVLRPKEIRIGRSLAKTLRRAPFRLSMDTAFGDVIKACARVPRPGQDGTWITDDMIAAYVEMHRVGLAHSVEAWSGDRLVGGLYGVSLGNAYFGESMFALEPDASKVAFAEFCRQLAAWEFTMVDCQVHTDHLERFGATPWPRDFYLGELRKCLELPTRQGRWSFD